MCSAVYVFSRLATRRVNADVAPGFFGYGSIGRTASTEAGVGAAFELRHGLVR
jgi:hypothetical protein